EAAPAATIVAARAAVASIGPIATGALIGPRRAVLALGSVVGASRSIVGTGAPVIAERPVVAAWAAIPIEATPPAVATALAIEATPARAAAAIRVEPGAPTTRVEAAPTAIVVGAARRRRGQRPRGGRLELRGRPAELRARRREDAGRLGAHAEDAPAAR